MAKGWMWGIVGLLCLASASASAQVGDLIEQADALYDVHQGAFDFDAYGPRLKEAIATYEQALPLLAADSVQSRAYVLNRLAEACFEYGTAYAAGRDEQKTTFEKGKDYALESLRLSPDFGATETSQGFRAALSGAADVAALFWYGNDLGRYIEFDPLTAITGGMKDVEASFARAIVLDESFLAGGPCRAMGSYLSSIPSILGGDLDRASEYMRRAIELGPEFIENYVNYAEDYAKARQNWPLFCLEVNQALALGRDPTTMAAWPLYNTLALKRAQGLVLLQVNGKPVCQP